MCSAIGLAHLKYSVYRTRKSDSPSRLREGPVTRLGGNVVEKDEKPKVERVEGDEGSSQESEKAENNDNSENEDVNGFL